mgnify:CR=1 FL=1
MNGQENNIKNIRFEKMHHLGNDFIMIDFRGMSDFFYGGFHEKYAKKICDRHFGIGADGVIALLESDDKNYDFKMEIINSDGSFAMMCGNGLACLAAFIVKNGFFKENNGSNRAVSLNIITRSGLRVPSVSVLNEADNELKCRPSELNGFDVSIDMGKPELDAAKIPVDIELLNAGEGLNCVENSKSSADRSGRAAGEKVKINSKAVNLKYAFNDYICNINLISMGNPHCVIITDKMPDYESFKTLGALIEVHPLFPEKTNVEFVEIVSRDEINMKVWERGAGITLACGTGACAVFYASYLNGLCGDKAKINLPGGSASAGLRNDGHIILNCKPDFVFEGTYRLI